MENNKDIVNKVLDSTIRDNHVVSLEKRINQTPVNNVEWEGERGQSNCYPKDPEIEKLLHSYNQVCVKYSKSAEPDFEPFAECRVHISDMSENRYTRKGNFAIASEKLLGTEFAKKNNLHTVDDVDNYMKKNELVWHEKSDGITMLMIPQKINSFFKHAGGVSEFKNYETSNNFLAKGKLTATQSGYRVVEEVSESLNESAQRILMSDTAFVQDNYTGERIPLHVVKERYADLTPEQKKALANFMTSEHSGRRLAQKKETKVILYHGKELLEGNEDLAEASFGMVTDIVCENVKQCVNQEIEKGIVNGTVKVTNTVIEKTQNEAIKHFMTQFANKNTVSKIANLLVTVGANVINFLNSNMSVHDLVFNVCKIGCDIAFSMLGGELLGTAGLCIGAFVGGPVGAAIGLVVGEFVGTLIGSEVMNILLRMESAGDVFLRAQRELVAEIDRHTYNMMQHFVKLHTEHEAVIREGMKKILCGILSIDYEMINSGIGDICNEFGFEIAYDSQEEFDRFMLDESKSVVISRVL